jgi:hypothetical protein
MLSAVLRAASAGQQAAAVAGDWRDACTGYVAEIDIEIFEPSGPVSADDALGAGADRPSDPRGGAACRYPHRRQRKHVGVLRSRDVHAGDCTGRRLLLVALSAHGEAAQVVAAGLVRGAGREVEKPGRVRRDRGSAPGSGSVEILTTKMVPNASVPEVPAASS